MDAQPASLSRTDWTLGLAVAAVACAWFVFNSLYTDWAAIDLQFYFYDMLTLMRAPGRIATGASGDGAALNAFLFGTLCVVAIGAAVMPMFSRRREAWLGCLAPALLMVLVGMVLYHQLSQDMLVESADNGYVGSHLIRFANAVSSSVGNAVSRRVHVGVGGYLGLLSTAFLAVRGVIGYRNAA